MGQEIRSVSRETSVTGSAGDATDSSASIGRYIARQRRLRGVSLDDLAAQTRIPKRSLERLEAGAFDRQADGFSRGFVRTVAAALGLDAEDAVMRLLDEPEVETLGFDFRRLALQRWAVGSIVVLSALAAFFGVWALLTSESRNVIGSSTDEIVYRRDAVRELAEQERGAALQQSPTGAASEPAPNAGAGR